MINSKEIFRYEIHSVLLFSKTIGGLSVSGLKIKPRLNIIIFTYVKYT